MTLDKHRAPGRWHHPGTARSAAPVDDRSFFERSALEVAPQLLGAQLRHGEVVLRITEVEAYQGELDPGSHAFRGRSRRNEVMFGDPGRLYVYLSYGMHVCANVVCSPRGTAAAVLLRAGEIVAGLEQARSRRTTSSTDADLARGPARLTVALGIPLSANGSDLLVGGDLAISPGASPERIASSARTGVSGDGGSDRFPWRFFIPGDPTVSPYKRHVPKRRS